MSAFHLLINGRTQEVDVSPDTPLLWVLRDKLNMTGTKYGCGMYQRIRRAIHRAAGEGA